MNTGRSFNNIANTYISQQEYREAIKYFQKSVSIWENSNDVESKRITFNGLGIANTELGEYKEAIEMFCRALEISCVMKDETMQKTVVKNLSWLYGKMFDSLLDCFSLNLFSILCFLDKGKEDLAFYLSDNFNTSFICNLMVI